MTLQELVSIYFKDVEKVISLGYALGIIILLFVVVGFHLISHYDKIDKIPRIICIPYLTLSGIIFISLLAWIFILRSSASAKLDKLPESIEYTYNLKDVEFLGKTKSVFNRESNNFINFTAKDSENKTRVYCLILKDQKATVYTLMESY